MVRPLNFNTSHVSINQLLTLNFFWFINFNTSHVSINQTETRKTAFWGRISIHLMFLLIWTQGLLGRSMNQISIHLMFLLIASGNTNAPRKTNFNTSHVSINPIREKTHYFRRRISIHLMFLLIKILYDDISVRGHFNTSHVSINRM